MRGLRQIFKSVRKYKAYLWLSVISHILTAIFTVVSIPLIIPFFQLLFDVEAQVMNQPTGKFQIAAQLKYYFSQIISTYDSNRALLIVIAFLISSFLLKNLFRYLGLFFLAPVRSGLISDIRSKLFSSYLFLPLHFYSDERKGDLLTRIGSDVNEIESSILQVIEVIFKSPLIIIGSLCFMFYINFQLSLLVLALLGFTAFIIGTISKNLKNTSLDAQSQLGNLMSTVDETLSGKRVIGAFNAEDHQRNVFDGFNDKHKQLLNRIYRKKDLSSPVSEFLGILVVAVLLYLGAGFVFKGSIDPETFFAFIFAFYQVIEPAKSFSKAFYNIKKGEAAVDRINDIVNESDNYKSIIDNPIPVKFDESIEFKNVSFVYPNTGLSILKNFNLKIRKGEKIALVGESGSGKSTLIDLLLRFYDVAEGQILFDGKPISQMPLKAYREQFGLVTQLPFLFNDSIENNIKLGYSSSLEEVKEAAKNANAHRFIERMADSYQENVGDNGLKLSGGERQRLTLARAILRNPSCFILDEATSSLDSESELLVQQALEKILVDRTAIIIAHRLSTVKNVDRILVMKDGEIIEEGSHEELMTEGKAYKNFVELQTL